MPAPLGIRGMAATFGWHGVEPSPAAWEPGLVHGSEQGRQPGLEGRLLLLGRSKANGRGARSGRRQGRRIRRKAERVVLRPAEPEGSAMSWSAELGRIRTSSSCSCCTSACRDALSARRRSRSLDLAVASPTCRANTRTIQRVNAAAAIQPARRRVIPAIARPSSANAGWAPSASRLASSSTSDAGDAFADGTGRGPSPATGSSAERGWRCAERPRRLRSGMRGG